MNSVDLLRQKREMGYGAGLSKEEPEERSFPLTEEEKGMYEDGQKCLCSGTVQDGKFMAESIQPVGGEQERGVMDVRPPTQMSPS